MQGEEAYAIMKSSLRKMKSLVSPPAGFSWSDAPINIFQDVLGGVTTDFDASAYKNIGGVTYYVKVNGKASNDGLTPDTPLNRIGLARAKSDVGTIIVYGGFYGDESGFNNAVVANKNINIIAADGEDVIISTRRILTWSKTEGQTNVYQANRTLVANVYDSAVLDEYGDFTKLTEVSDVATVDTTPGSYFYDGSVLYVHTVDGRAADDDVVVFLDIYNLYNVGNYRTYVEGIKFYGGKSGSVHIDVDTSTDTTLFVAKNCEFKYATGGAGGITILGADAYLQNCIADRNWADGFNYHHSKGRKNKVIEVGCIGKRNGWGRGTNTDNGSTIHDGGSIIRVNGEYFENEGPNVHDINAGTESWNIGCLSYNSVATNSTRRTNYRIEDSGKMWIDTCEGRGSNQSIYVSENSEIRVRNLFDNGEQVVNGIKKYY